MDRQVALTVMAHCQLKKLFTRPSNCFRIMLALPDVVEGQSRTLVAEINQPLYLVAGGANRLPHIIYGSAENNV